MPSTDLGSGLLVGSSGILGPIWLRTLLPWSDSLLTADKSDTQATYQVDLADTESIKSLVSRMPPLDYVVINAGLDSKLQGGLGPGAGDVFDQELWRAFFDINVIGAAALIEGLAPRLKPNATVITIGSIYGVVSPRIDVYNEDASETLFYKHPAYGASKAALMNMMRQYAVRYSGRVSFNMLTLGVVGGDQPEVFKSRMPSQIPTGSFLNRDDLGKHLEQLIRYKGPHFTGQNLIIDGGYTLW